MARYVLKDSDEDQRPVALSLVNDEGTLYLRAETIDGEVNDILYVSDSGVLELLSLDSDVFGFQKDRRGFVKVHR